MPADWQETATAIDTVAVAIAAIGVAAYGEWRADLRMKSERKHAAGVFAQERTAAVMIRFLWFIFSYFARSLIDRQRDGAYRAKQL